MDRLLICNYPAKGCYPCVLEHVEQQCWDSFYPSILDNPAADVALALDGEVGKEGASVVDVANPAAIGVSLLILLIMLGRNMSCPSLTRVTIE